ncbi:MAG: class I SAM-dependent methyltransferase [Clostridia bacterium]|nr:class I SAM-dependent methyltransferase [Clostridia bacterium]
MQRDKEELFWEQSWKSFDPARAIPYFEKLREAQDGTIAFLKAHGIQRICDAGCGCGAYALKLAQNGFSVSGFDISEQAVALTKKALAENGYFSGEIKQASILSTGYPDECFDAVIARDVIDHLPIEQAIKAVSELLRIVRPNGYVMISLDDADEEYNGEPHECNENGDYTFISGKWKGMVFHPYSPSEIEKLTAGREYDLLSHNENGSIIVLKK